MLFDRDGTVVRLQRVGHEIRAKGKAPLTDEQYAHDKFDAYDQLKAVEKLAKRDRTTARLLLSSIVFHLTERFFDIRQLWTPPPKQRLTVLKRIDPKLYNLLVSYYDEGSLLGQINIAKSILTIVFNR